MNQAYFHLVRDLESLDSIAARLYGDKEIALARDFLRINAVAAKEGYVWPGNALFLPEPLCYDPATEAQVIEIVAQINGAALQRMSFPERQFLAVNHTLANNAASHPSLLKDGVNAASTAAGGMISAIGLQSRIMTDTLRKLERHYVREFKTHGKLTPHFFQARQRTHRSLDTALGRVSRALTMGTGLNAQAKSVLKVNTKSQILHWKRHGTKGGLKDFTPHFEKMQRIARHLKGGGYLTIGIDGYFTYDTIAKACRTGSDRDCRRSMMVDGAGFGGRVAGGVGGGVVAYFGCNAIFSGPSLGTSLLWCGLIAGAAGGLVGGALAGKGAQVIGEGLFESTYPMR